MSPSLSSKCHVLLPSVSVVEPVRTFFAASSGRCVGIVDGSSREVRPRSTSWRKAIAPTILVRDWMMLMDWEFTVVVLLEPWEKSVLAWASRMCTTAPGMMGAVPIVALSMYFRRAEAVSVDIEGAILFFQNTLQTEQT